MSNFLADSPHCLAGLSIRMEQAALEAGKGGAQACGPRESMLPVATE